MNFQEMERTIYLDGRPHPSANAAHTWSGFSTGTWQDNVLNIYTTHLKENYIRRNGIAASDKRTFTEHWVRHGNYLTVQTVVTDPALLAEPLVRSQTWILDPTQQLGRNICETANEVPKPAGSVPHHLPGTNPVPPRSRGLVRAARRGDARRRRRRCIRSTGSAWASRRTRLRRDASGTATAGWTAAAATCDRRMRESAATSTIREDGRVCFGDSCDLLAARRRVGVVPARSRAQPRSAARPRGDRAAIEVLPVQRNVYMLAGAGGNITVQIGSEGVLLVDTGLAASAPPVMARNRKLSKGPIRCHHQHARPPGSRGRQRRRSRSAAAAIRCSRSTSSRTRTCSAA